MKTLDTSRPVIAAQSVGLAQGALDNAIAYARERVQFGKPILAFQGIIWMLAEMASQIEAARALTYQAADMITTQDPRRTYMSACSKRMMRDAKITQIYEGTNQVQKLVIARELAK